MALFRRKSIDQVRHFRALEARYLALAYLTSHKSQAGLYRTIAGDYAALADAAAAAARSAASEAAPAAEATSAVA